MTDPEYWQAFREHKAKMARQFAEDFLPFERWLFFGEPIQPKDKTPQAPTMSTPTPKEHAYDIGIYAKVNEILKICQEHKIAFIMDFEIGDEEFPKLRILTSRADETGELSRRHYEALRSLSSDADPAGALMVNAKIKSDIPLAAR